MAIQEGFSRYQCDVASCTKRGYYTPGSQGAAGYVTRTWTDSNGQTRTAVLCTEHSAALTKLMQEHDSEFEAFLKDGSLPTGTEA
jgi:hypothetical protein